MAVVGNLLLPAHYAPAPVNAATVAAAAVPDAAMPVTGVPGGLGGLGWELCER